MANDFASAPGKKKVGLVELADSDLDIFHRYTQSGEWETELVIVNGPGTHAERMARILGLPVHEFPHRELLARCDLIVIGDPSSQQYAPIKEMMAGTRARVVLLDELRQELAAAEAPPEAPAEEPVDEIDRALDMLIGPEAPAPGTGAPAGFGGGLLSGGPTPSALGGGGSLTGQDFSGQETPAAEEPDTGSEFEIDSAYAGSGEAGPEAPMEFGTGSGLETGTEGEPMPDPEEAAESEETTGQPEPASPWLEASDADSSSETMPVLDTDDPDHDIADMEEPVQEREVLLPTPGSEPRFLVPDPEDAYLSAEAGDMEETPEAGVPEAEPETSFEPEPTDPFESEPETAGETVSFDDPEPVAAFEPQPEAGVDAQGEEAYGPGSQSEPPIESDPAMEAEPEPMLEAEVEPEPVLEAEPESVLGAEPEPMLEAEAEPVLEAEPEPVLEPEPEPMLEADVEPALEAEAEPEPCAPELSVTPAPAAESAFAGRYDLAPLLGRERSRSVGPLPVDAGYPGLVRALEDIRTATGAKAVSLMLPEPDGDYLRIAAAAGLGEDTVRDSRFRVGEGLAGTAYSTGVLQTRVAEVPGFAEAGGASLHKLAISLPVAKDGHPVGVLFVTVDSTASVNPDDVVANLSHANDTFSGLILEAVDAAVLDSNVLRGLLGAHLDRIMALDMPLPKRVLAMGRILGATVGADFTHLYLVDPVNRRLEAVSEPAGMTSAAGGYLPLEQGVFGWALDRGEPMLSSFPDASGEREHAVAYLPIQVNGPYGILVLENFVVEPGKKLEIRDILGSVVEQLEDIYQVEQSVTSHDIASGIQLRITDRTASLDVLPEELRTQPALEIVVQELGAEAAIWLPAPDAVPVITQPRTREGARIVADAWDHLAEYGDWIRERGTAAVGRSGSGWQTDGPQGPAPYVGVKDETESGVILVFFAASGSGSPEPSLPAAVLTGALLGVCRQLHAQPRPRPVTVANAEDTEVLDAEALTARIQEEIHRSGRSGLPFAVTRFSYADTEGVSMEDQAFLRHFLITHKRGADTLAELDGSFILLSPATDPLRDRIRARFLDTWGREGSQLALSVENEDPGRLLEAAGADPGDARRAA